jgi:hypothetical protein
MNGIDTNVLPKSITSLLTTYDALVEKADAARAEVAAAEDNLDETVRGDRDVRAASAYERAQGIDSPDSPDPLPQEPEAQQRLKDAVAGLQAVKDSIGLALVKFGGELAAQDAAIREEIDAAEQKAMTACTKALNGFTTASNRLATLRATRQWLGKPATETAIKGVNPQPIGEHHVKELQQAVDGAADRAAREREDRDWGASKWWTFVNSVRTTLPNDNLEPGQLANAIEKAQAKLAAEGKPVPKRPDGEKPERERTSLVSPL